MNCVHREQVAFVLTLALATQVIKSDQSGSFTSLLRKSIVPSAALIDAGVDPNRLIASPTAPRMRVSDHTLTNKAFSYVEFWIPR